MKYFVACLLMSCSVAFGMDWQSRQLQQQQQARAQQAERDRQAQMAMQAARMQNAQVNSAVAHGCGPGVQGQVNIHNHLYGKK